LFARAIQRSAKLPHAMSVNLPNDPSDEELARDWLLSEQDLVEVRRCRGADKRHSFAIQLCTLRAYGRFLGQDYGFVPVRILNHLGRQLGMPPVLFAAPPDRKKTDTEHERRIRAYLGFRNFDEAVRRELAAWLRARAAEGLLGDELIVRAERHLLAEKIVAPGRSTIERLVLSVVSRTEGALMDRIHERIPVHHRAAIDTLLVVGAETNRSGLESLREGPPDPTPDTINRWLRLVDTLRELNLAEVDLSELIGVTMDTVAHYAELARRYDVAHLRRFAPPKSRAMVSCFLIEREKSLLDELVTMHHTYLVGLERRSRNTFRDQRFAANRDLRKHMAVLVALAESLVVAPADMTVGAFRDECVDLARLRAAIEGCLFFDRLETRGLLDAMLARHSWLKKYLPGFLRLPFQGGDGSGPLLNAIAHALSCYEREWRVGKGAPIQFARGFWAKALDATMVRGSPDGRVWELALAFETDEALRRGDLFLARSRDHRAFWDLVHSPLRWSEERDQAYIAMQLSPQAEHALDELRTDFDDAADNLLGGLGANRFVSIEGDRLALRRRDALEISKSVRQLRRAIETHMPEVGIEDVLIDVDRHCRFTREFTPLGTYAPRVDNLYPALLASLLAQGTNMGIAQMAQAARIPVDTLQHVSQWFLRDETLRAANRALVDYHHQLPLSAAWGAGTFSSSDAQRIAIERGSLLASFYPRYFGYYERAVGVYTHVSDQHSVFASRVISCSPREALYVLDGLLENDTVLAPRAHTTDSHGSTEQVFALCYLLGISFMPRLADLGDIQLYRLDRARSHGELDPLLRTVDTALIVEQWDHIVRIAASIRDRSSPAHVIVDRLAANASDRPAKALTMLGRVVRTAFIMRYLHDAKLRDRIQLQLNRGEGRHALTKRLFFGNNGVFRTGEADELMNKVSALSVLSNAVLVWNTTRMAEIVGALEQTSGQKVAPDELARISPLLTARLLVSGRYNFDLASPPDDQEPS
jgi:TnpA family transposase